MVLDLDALRVNDVPYLGWHISGAPGRGTTPSYKCYARRDRGEEGFTIQADVPNLWVDRTTRWEESQHGAILLAKGKVFLGTWEDGAEYDYSLPIELAEPVFATLRPMLIRGLFRLYRENFSPSDIQIDLDGAALELRVERHTVVRAFEQLVETGVAATPATHTSNPSTGHLWLTHAGALEAEVIGLSEPDNSSRVVRSTGEGDADMGEADARTVFVVHGRDVKARDAMFALLRALGLKPLEWEQARRQTGKPNPYVGEILTAAFATARAVVVLMTPDDEAKLKDRFITPSDPKHERELTGQARANVLFEAGMAMGWDSDRTVLVELGQLREFSDAAGRHMLRFKNDVRSRHALAERLRTAKCDVDTSGTDWLKAGTFPTYRNRTTRANRPA
jgi:predicted nucleotide-binding protein